MWWLKVREKRDIGQRIVLLENRLDGVMVQFNATLAQNTLVRKDIDHLVKVLIFYSFKIQTEDFNFAAGTCNFQWNDIQITQKDCCQ